MLIFQPRHRLRTIVQRLGISTFSKTSSPLLLPSTKQDKHLPHYYEIDEILPSYSCSLNYQGDVFIKHERNYDGSLSLDKTWHRVKLSIDGTLVTAHYGKLKLKSLSFKQRISHLIQFNDNYLFDPTPEYTTAWNMPNAKLFSARDLKISRPYAFRLALQSGEQFLIAAPTMESALHWAESLLTVINLAHDLDLRDDEFIGPDPVHIF